MTMLGRRYRNVTLLILVLLITILPVVAHTTNNNNNNRLTMTSTSPVTSGNGHGDNENSIVSSTVSSQEQRLEREVHRLHDFFVDWFTSKIKNTESNFCVAEESMESSFHLINPDGVCTDREPLLESLKKAYGCRKGDIFLIKCKNLRLLYSSSSVNNNDMIGGDDDTTYLVTYEEWQTIGETQTARTVSALFRYHPTLPNQLQWIHVHETWMPGMGPPSKDKMWTPKR